MTTTNPNYSYVRLWIGFIGSAVAWLTHFFLIWFITEVGCLSGLGNQTLFGLNGVVALSLLVSIPLLILTLVSGLLSYGIWQQIQDISAHDNAVYASLERQRFMAIFGGLAAIFFGVIMVIELVPLFTVPLCGA